MLGSKMEQENKNIFEELAQNEYKYGFVSNIEQELAPKGLNEDIIRLISSKKNEPSFMLEWRLKAFRHWQKMKEPNWAKVKYPPIDYQDIHYYAAPKNYKKIQKLGRSRSRNFAYLRKARHPT